MKKLLLFFIFLIVSVFLFSQQTEIIPLSTSYNKLEFKGFTPTSFSAKLQMKELRASNKIIENREFASIDLEGFVASGPVGQAGLPTLSKMIEVPQAAEIQIVIIGYSQEVINLSEYGINKIEPIQPSYSKSTPIEEQHFVIDENYYNTDFYDTEDIVKAEIYGTMRGVRIASIIVRPYHYNPVENTLIVYNDLDFEINFVNADLSLTEEMKNKYYSPEFEGAYSQLINYSAPATKDALTNFSAPLKYVIVANQTFQSTLQPFVQWKTKQGFNVIEHYVASGTSNTTIKNYLQGLYNAATSSDPAPIYCLIIGDHSGNYSIPAFATKVSGNNHITDLYFACFDGTSDYLPDMYYGRISAESTTELQNALDKILPYEQYSLSNFDYLDNALLVAGVDSYWANKCGNAAVLYGVNNYFNTAHGFANIYAYYYNSTSYSYSVVTSNSSGASSNINSKIAAGLGFGNYTAHCDHNGWADPAVVNSNIPNWQNKDKYPFLIGNCCLSFEFNKSDAFGETLLYTKDAGAVGYIGTSNSSYWYEDTYWGLGLVSNSTIDAGNITAYNYSNTGLGFMDGIFHENGEPYSDWYYTASQIITCGNLAVQASSQTDLKQYYWEIYHVSGDPSLMPYMSKPNALSLSFANPITGASSLTVNTEPYTYVAISKDNVLLDAKWSGSGTSVNLNFPPLTGTQHCIVGTKQDRVPYINEDVVPITPNPPIADFNANPTSILEGETVNFTDASQYANSWEWDFGDGQTSNEQNPSHIYSSVGTYTVSLTITNSLGNDTKTKTNYITVNVNTNPPSADFVANQTSVSMGATVNFTDLSINNPLSWDWEFEGGVPATSSQQNPSVVYNMPGIYNVKLTVSNNYGNDIEQKNAYITVSLPDYCSAGSSSAAYEGISNFTCNTINNSSGKSTYTDFTNISTDLMIGQTYPFTVTTANGYSSDQVLIWVDWNRNGNFVDDGENVFTSSNGAGPYSGNITVPNEATSGPVRVRIRLHDTSTSYNPNSTPCGNSGYGEVEDYTFNLISPNIPPTADFSINGPEFCSGEVNFTDMSFLADSWSWDFGDGNISVEQNPTHNYASSGTYTVSLNVTNDYGNDTKIITNAVIIDMPEAPTTTGANACGSAELSLYASGNGNLVWYNTPIGGTAMNTGDTYTNTFTNTTDFYVESQIITEETGNVGPENYNFGTGGFFNAPAQHGLYFNAERDFTLVSVVIRSSNTGDKTITLVDSENVTLYTKVVNVAYGQTNTNLTVNLDFYVPAGTGYKLMGSSNYNRLYRNQTGASYPYNLDGVVSIVGNTADDLNLYYYFYNWIVEYEQACYSSRTQVIATINPVPSVNLGEDQIQCASSINLDAGSGFNSYTWNGNLGGQIFEANNTGNYTVVVENEFGCTASDNVNITLNPIPEISLFANNESAPNENDGSITATITNATAPYSYQWSIPGEAGNEIYGLNAGEYCLTLTDANNCSNEQCANVYTEDVPPLADFQANQTSACGNLEVQFTDLSLYMPDSWFWDFGDEQTSTQQNPIHNYEQAGIYSVSLTVSNLEGENVLIKTDYIEVYEIPVIVLTANSETWDITNDGSVTATVTNGTAPYSYQWSIPGESGNEIYGLNAGEYCLTLTDANNCSSSECVILEQEQAPAVPIADFSADNIVTCLGNEIQFSDLSNNQPTTWTWDFGDGHTSNQQNPNHIYENPGFYTVSLSVENEFGNDENIKENYIYISNPPSVEVEVIHATGEFEADGSASIVIIGGTAPYQILWSNNEQGLNIENLLPGNYSVMLVDAANCVETKPFSISWTSGISQYETRINIFPNPARDFVSVEIQGTKAEKIYLTNVLGQVIFETIPNSNISNIDTKSLKPGMYLLKIKFENKESMHKLVIK